MGILKQVSSIRARIIAGTKSKRMQDKNQEEEKRVDRDKQTEDARSGRRSYKLLPLWLLQAVRPHAASGKY